MRKPRITTLPAAFGRRIRVLIDWWGVKPPPERQGLDDLKGRVTLGDDPRMSRRELINAIMQTERPHLAA
jgi:hypothetical protein